MEVEPGQENNGNQNEDEENETRCQPENSKATDEQKDEKSANGSQRPEAVIVSGIIDGDPLHNGHGDDEKGHQPERLGRCAGATGCYQRENEQAGQRAKKKGSKNKSEILPELLCQI